MVSLLDVNVLIALAWPNHVHHEVALDWFGANQSSGWATCPSTQTGFVRVSSNPRVLSEAAPPQEALAMLRRIVGLPHHQFWTDDIEFASSELVAAEKLVGYRQVPDAHLLALALRHGGRLATLDSGVRELVPGGVSADEAVYVLSGG
jgi:toxin-antitoxin system PIN domain toxin